MFNPLMGLQKDATPCLGTRLDMASPGAYARAPPFSTAGQSFTQTQFAPSRGRGLKQLDQFNQRIGAGSPPHGGAD
jgi:hypothetical protein